MAQDAGGNVDGTGVGEHVTRTLRERTKEMLERYGPKIGKYDAPVDVTHRGLAALLNTKPANISAVLTYLVREGSAGYVLRHVPDRTVRVRCYYAVDAKVRPEEVRAQRLDGLLDELALTHQNLTTLRDSISREVAHLRNLDVRKR